MGKQLLSIVFCWALLLCLIAFAGQPGAAAVRKGEWLYEGGQVSGCNCTVSDQDCTCVYGSP